VFGALLEYALVNYASRSDAQRLARRKVQKQWELDHCSFEPEHMDTIPANNGGSFAMVSSSVVTQKNPGSNLTHHPSTHQCQKKMRNNLAFAAALLQQYLLASAAVDTRKVLFD
jgi:hypothetical protein